MWREEKTGIETERSVCHWRVCLGVRYGQREQPAVALNKELKRIVSRNMPSLTVNCVCVCVKDTFLKYICVRGFGVGYVEPTVLCNFTKSIIDIFLL